MKMNVIRKIQTTNYFRHPTTFKIIWEEFFNLGYAFAVGIDENQPREFSIFYVWNNGVNDNYIALDTGLLNVYNIHSRIDPVPEKVTKRVKEVITRYITNDLTKRMKDGRITLEQIKRMNKEI